MADTAAELEAFFRQNAKDLKVDVSKLAHALEDLPAGAQDEAKVLLSTPAGIAFQQRIFDVLENAVADVYGHLECTKLFGFLAQYSVTPYTYDVSASLSRGERPDGGKMTQLYKQGFRATINLCAETPDGDVPYITQAGLGEQMATYHIPVIDSMPPTDDQVAQLLALLHDLRSHNVRAYLHCEAGKGRTGVMVACFRMAIMGWSAADALTEAKNFGLWTPDQEAFIQAFGAKLVANLDAVETGRPLPNPKLAGYPVLRPGSITPTPAQITMTIDKAAAMGGPSLAA